MVSWKLASDLFTLEIVSREFYATVQQTKQATVQHTKQSTVQHIKQ